MRAIESGFLISQLRPKMPALCEAATWKFPTMNGRKSLGLERIFEQVSSHLGMPIRTEALDEEGFKDDIADSAKKFRVHTATGPDFFLTVSATGNPRLTVRVVENIRKMRAALSPELASHILEPVLEGADQGLTYALWPLKTPFPFDTRVRRFVARRRYGDAILNWGEAVTRETLKEGNSAKDLANLQAIYDEEAFPVLMREAALAGQDAICSGAWKPKRCIHHGDFWLGNVLLQTGSDTPAFYVIDWGSMDTDGYPFLDLARMLISLGCRPHMCRQHIEKLRIYVGCESEDVVSYILSALGHMGQNLEHFPPDLYRAMAVEVYDLMKLYSG